MPVTKLSGLAPPEPVTTITEFVANQPVYEGVAKSIQPPFILAGATFSVANPGEVGYVAHGLQDDNSIYISGATTAGWSTLNNTFFRVVRLTADTFNIQTLAGVTVDTSGFAGVWGGTITTTAPRTSAPCWNIQKMFYSGTDQVRRTCASGKSGAGSVWDSRAVYFYD